MNFRALVGADVRAWGRLRRKAGRKNIGGRGGEFYLGYLAREKSPGVKREQLPDRAGEPWGFLEWTRKRGGSRRKRGRWPLDSAGDSHSPSLNCSAIAWGQEKKSLRGETRANTRGRSRRRGSLPCHLEQTNLKGGPRRKPGAQLITPPNTECESPGRSVCTKSNKPF